MKILLEATRVWARELVLFCGCVLNVLLRLRRHARGYFRLDMQAFVRSTSFDACYLLSCHVMS